MLKIIALIFLSAFLSTNAFACQAKSGGYGWREISKNAAFSESYGFPVFVIKGKMYAFHQEGVWQSADGANWTKTDLPAIRRAANDTAYIQFNDAIYALGQNEGNYLNIRFGSKIRRTTDFKTWETLAETSNLPNRIFHGSVVFDGKIWLMGGFDGKNYHNDIWNSADGVRWTRVAERAPWSQRNVGVFEFKNRLWIFGGGTIDGDREINPDSHKEVWSSTDGINWKQVEMKTGSPKGGTPVVFDEKLWFVGANRNDGNFGSAVFVSPDGVTWAAQSAPWSPRGAVAAWVFNDKLFMTGGKYSYKEPNGEIKFVYSNDVWAMSKKAQ